MKQAAASEHRPSSSPSVGVDSQRDAFTMTSPAITAQGLTKVYGDHAAVKDLSFEAGWGKVTGFLGPNGAGKTTTLRMIVGLAAPTSGTALVMGRPYKNLQDPSHHVGALIETAEFHPLRTARNHLRVLAAAARVPEQRIKELLSLVELSAAADKRVGKFSLGMKQRLALAGALLGDPTVLILDEPANGLDPAGIRWLREFLRAFAARGNTVLVSSHLLAEMSQMAHEVVVINHGEFVAHAPIDELTSGAARVVRVRSGEPERLHGLLLASGKDAVLTSHDEVTVRDATPEEVGALAAQAGVVLYALDSDTQSLEEVFFELTKQEEVQ
jgi:ABC-2 type transport system ATP-binding protein